MQLAVLGPTRMSRDEGQIDLGTRRQRAVIAALALAQGRPVSADWIIDRVWGDAVPASATGTLHSYVAKLRRVLEPDRKPREPATILVSDDFGYSLCIPATDRDDETLQGVVTDARTALGAIDAHRPAVTGDAVEKVREVAVGLDAVLESWRGEPYPELGDDPNAAAERVRLEDLRTAARELRIVAGLAIGQHEPMLDALGALCAENTLHERWWALRALALYRCGRLHDALAVLQTLRAELADELGLDPSETIRSLQGAILRQDPTLAWPPRPEEIPRPTPALGRVSLARPRWPLVGRDEELRRLVGDATAAHAGEPGLTLITGEAGAGKSRLLVAFADEAPAQGFRVGVGRCSDTDLPPLWPLAEALAGAAGRPTADVHEELSSCADPELRERLLEAINGPDPIALLLEDLHWADPAMLRALAGLAGRLTGQRFLGVGTARPAAGEERERSLRAIARGGRIELGPLPLDGVLPLAQAIGGPALDDVGAREIWERTSGNALYLVELLQTAGAPSGGLADVVLDRLDGLPAATVGALRFASALGTAFSTAELAALLGGAPGPVMSSLEPARRSGIVLETDGGFRFAHDIVREVIYHSQPSGTRAELHRKAVQVIAQGDLARADVRAALQYHGRRSAAVDPGAWRILVEVAEYARAASHYDEEAGHLSAALELQGDDPSASTQQHYELLMLAADAHRWSGNWEGVSTSVDAAALLVPRIADAGDRAAAAELTARTLSANLDGALWQVRQYGEVHAPVVDTLTRVLPAIPAHRSTVRSRALLTLAMELFYSGDVDRIDALVDEALTIAQAITDPRVRVSVQLGAYVARSRPDAVTDRAEYLEHARRDVELLGDPKLEMMVATLATSLANELGDAATVWSGLRALTSRLRSAGLRTAEVVLHSVAAPWYAMSGDDQAAAASLQRLQELAEEVRTPNVVQAAQSGSAVVCIHAGQARALLPVLGALNEGSLMPSTSTTALTLIRAGEADQAAALVVSRPLDTEQHTYLGTAFAAMNAEIALELGRPDLAEAPFRYLLDHSGRMASAGTASALGPVDGFLACGAAALGDLHAAGRYADAAVEQARRWRLPRVETHLTTLRHRHGF
ncbi:BTAD domain-containing putative transcriptional regulator [[Mycobacterium] nativiensis]|uniref:BTAD domain-containing putative transcriptional regulator n=1 Tax=[Mycobacterium] nativiensis TaxID=2855503 RepID=A0ABU5Y2X8_9MYCO|nr:BTAD domain-containing putative transcriptional regulator [Mycolicibacter sp. MYC340]MEB3034555.1 BTAD domain-containing putative transcriptional regulator [Mycolicibacter sp. MYC340]